MIETIQKEIDGINFYIQQFNPKKTLILEKKTISILHPVLNILKDMKDGLNSNIDLSVISNIIGELLSNLDDTTYINYINEMTSNTMVSYIDETGRETQPILLNKEGVFDNVFAGKTITIFKLLFEIMKANRFCFFVLMDGENALTGILSNVMKKTS